MKKLLINILILSSLLLSGCSGFIPAYQIDIQQGNILTPDDVNQLQLGMSKRKVQYILGSPSIADPFHAQRWDYTYSLKKGYRKPEEKNISLYFESNNLVRITGSIQPDPSAHKDVNSYKKQVIMPINPPKRVPPSWWQRVWNSFFGNNEDLDLYN